MITYDNLIRFHCEICGMGKTMSVYKFKKYSCDCLKGANAPQKRKSSKTIGEEND